MEDENNDSIKLQKHIMSVTELSNRKYMYKRNDLFKY